MCDPKLPSSRFYSNKSIICTRLRSPDVSPNKHMNSPSFGARKIFPASAYLPRFLYCTDFKVIFVNGRHWIRHLKSWSIIATSCEPLLQTYIITSCPNN